MNKYKILEGQYIEVCGKKLYRVQALKDFGDVKAGDTGGYIESESNLSQYDNAWVSGNALVSDNARVSGNAWVHGNAQVSDDARVSGNAWVNGNAKVHGNAQVYGYALVSGNAWVSGDARVCSNAWVSGNALVYGDAWVSGTRHYLNLGPIGSRYGYTTIYRDKNKKAIVVCGCFHGDLDSFERAVHKTQDRKSVV